MQKFLIFILVFTPLFLSAEANNSKQKRLDKQIAIEIEKEKRHAKEQTFYKGKDYDLSGAEVNQESLDSIEAIEPLEFDMDSVYD